MNAAMLGTTGYHPLSEATKSALVTEQAQLNAKRAVIVQQIAVEKAKLFGTNLQTGWGTGTSGIDPELQQKFNELEAYAEKSFNDMNEVGKGAAADALNKELKLDPPLTGHESWKTVASVVGGAAGGAVGAYIGGPIGAKIGALVGAYLGAKLADLIAKNWEEVKDWLKGKWGDVKEFVENVGEDIADAAEDAYGYFADLF